MKTTPFRPLSLLAALLCVSQNLFALEPIKLNKPDLNRQGTVMKALQDRQSTRKFDTRELSIADLSDLLWTANGINRPESGKRTAPSAMNRQEIEVYVCTARGCYLYNAKENRLDPVSEVDARPLKEAPVCLVLIGPTDFKLAPVDAGIVSQNISIFCASARLATVPRATQDQAALKEALKLGDNKAAILNHPVGYFVK